MFYGGTLPDDRKIVLLGYQMGGDGAVGTFVSLTANDAVAGIGSVAAQKPFETVVCRAGVSALNRSGAASWP